MTSVLVLLFCLSLGAFIVACVTANELEACKQMNIYLKEELSKLKTETVLDTPPNKGSNVVDPKPKKVIVEIVKRED